MALYHSARGSVNYTIVGSPTIVDGVASGFNNSSYIRTDSYLTDTADTISQEDLELGCDFIAGNSTGYQCLLKYQTYITNLGEGAAQGISGLMVVNGTLRYKVGTNPSDRTVEFYVNSSANITEGQRYIAKGYCKGTNTYAISVSSDGGNTWITDTKTSNWTPERLSVNQYCSVGQANRPGSYQYPFSGSINLKSTYIKVDGQPWFGICPIEVKKHQVMGPVGYTVVGSPTIVDGVASGFSGSDYLGFTTTLDFNKDIEMCVKCNISSLGSNTILGYATTGFQGYLSFQTNGTLRFFMRIDDAQFSVSTNYVFNTTTNYWVKLVKTSSYIRLYYSTDGVNFIQDGETTFTTFPTVTLSYQRFGCGGGFYVANPFNGSIDLNHTYIKVNGKLWFWQPQETKKIIVNGVQVWEKPS